MDKEKAFKWADALESGEFGQGFEELEVEPGKNCCLGVACIIFDVPNEKWKGNSVPSYSYLPMIGLNSPFGNFKTLTNRDGWIESLISLNDNGMPFSHIADLIRYFYEEL